MAKGGVEKEAAPHREVATRARSALRETCFPDGRQGKIEVGYNTRGPNRTLSVADDGVGMPKDKASATPGLGASIVEAFANQLSAHVQVTAVHPGTVASVIHTQIAAVTDEEMPDALPRAAV